jgi:pyruvate carboxylase
MLTIRDRHAKHVREADEAIYIGSIQNTKTHPHQDIPLLISTALKVKADAVHPGSISIDYIYKQDMATYPRTRDLQRQLWKPG